MSCLFVQSLKTTLVYFSRLRERLKSEQRKRGPCTDPYGKQAYVCVTEKGIFKTTPKILEMGFGEGGNEKKIEGASNCFETLYWRWMSRDITGEKLNGEQTWSKKERQRERERMCLNGLATDVFLLKEGNCISLLLNRHDEWGRSCFWQTLCYKRYRDTCVRVRSAYVFHKDNFHIKWEKKNRPYKIKTDFSLSLSLFYI